MDRVARRKPESDATSAASYVLDIALCILFQYLTIVRLSSLRTVPTRNGCKMSVGRERGYGLPSRVLS